MSNGLRLEPMAPEEREAAARLWWESSMSAPLSIEDHPTREALRERLMSEPWRVTLAWRDGALVGLLATQAQERWLRQLYVSPRAKRTGVGLRLLEAAKTEMPAGFFLHTDPQNQPARRFYEAQGLRCEAESPHPISGTPRVRYVWEPA